MRIIWHGVAPFAHSGYGVATANLLPRLMKLGHNVVCFSVYGLHGTKIRWRNPEHLDWPEIEVWPTRAQQWGSDCIKDYITDYQADCVITLFDQWAMPSFQQLGSIWLPYTVLHYSPMEEPLQKAVKDAWERIALCEWGHQQMKDAGLSSYVVPLGVDTVIYRPMAGEMGQDGQMVDQAWCREYHRWPTMPQDKFIIGIVAANRDFRKNLEPQMRAFAKFHEIHPDTHLVMHTNPTADEGGRNLPQDCRMLGIADNVDMTSANQMDMTTEELAMLYNCFDAHMLCSASEGFGLPILESQSCGVPNIVHDFSAESELAVGWKLPYEKFLTPMNSFGAGLIQSELVNALCEAYEMWKNKPSEWWALKQKARRKALEYDWDVVVRDYWKPVLDDWYLQRPL